MRARAVGGDIVQVVPLLGVRSLEQRVFDYRLAPRAGAADDPTRGAEASMVPVEGPYRPESSECVGREPIGVGSLVRIPFGSRRTTGVVVALGPSGDYPAGRLREAYPVGSDRIPADLLDLAALLSSYYLAPLGACLQAVAPPHVVPASRPRQGRVVKWVLPTGESLDLTERQLGVVSAVPAEGMAAAELSRRTGVGRGVVDTLVRRGALRSEERRVGGEGEEPPEAAAGLGAKDGHLWPADGGPADPTPQLTDEQASAVATLDAALCAPGPERRLLWGVTGSGKTEVYLRLISRVLAEGGGAILLVPEIALSGQLVRRLQRGLDQPVAVLHSGLGTRRRAAESEAVAQGRARVVVGARSAVFAPVQALRLIIVDEAHDGSYKQEEEPRYDARTVAWWRIRAGGGLLVEGTATPRLESLRGSSPIRLRERPSGGALPEVEVVDMRRQGARAMLAPRSRVALQDVLGRGEQAIILLNRRGYAGFVRCGECGSVQVCPHCEISLTYHREQGALLCHHCGHRSTPPAVCPSCGAGPLERGAPGTERLRDELLRLVPRSKLFRLDSDVVTSGSRAAAVLEAFAGSRPAVLLGTQMVAKGHDFPAVTLALVADADTALYMPDFRSSERTFQLLTQVAGRAGRGDQPGLVLVQTWNPDVPCIRMAVAQRDEEFYDEETALRERLGYPPFRRLVRLVTVARDEDRAARAADYLAGRLRPHLADDELRGPARLPRLRGAGRSQIMLAVREPRSGRGLVRAAVEALRVPFARRGVDLLVDVDPQRFM